MYLRSPVQSFDKFFLSKLQHLRCFYMHLEEKEACHLMCLLSSVNLLTILEVVVNGHQQLCNLRHMQKVDTIWECVRLHFVLKKVLFCIKKCSNLQNQLLEIMGRVRVQNFQIFFNIEQTFYQN